MGEGGRCVPILGPCRVLVIRAYSVPSIYMVDMCHAHACAVSVNPRFTYTITSE